MVFFLAVAGAFGEKPEVFACCFDPHQPQQSEIVRKLLFLSLVVNTCLWMCTYSLTYFIFKSMRVADINNIQFFLFMLL